MSGDVRPAQSKSQNKSWLTERGARAAEKLQPLWEQAYAAPVESDEALPGAVDAIMNRGIERGALFERTRSMRVRSVDGGFEVLCAPHRFVPGPEPHGASCGCPFCNPGSEARALRWRSWDLLPNAFPYAPLHSQHMLAVASSHVEQSFSPQILEDMLDLHALLDGRTRTLHYNGFAGNSQPHLHWQITKERFPIEKSIDSSSRVLARSGAGTLATFEDGPFAGIVVTGDKAFVVRTVSAIVEKLKTDPVTRDRYNLMVLPGPQSRVVIIPRRADDLLVDVGDGPEKLSAVEVSGRYISPTEDTPAYFDADAYRAAVARTVVRPSELPWLARIVDVPRDLRLRFHLAQQQQPSV